MGYHAEHAMLIPRMCIGRLSKIAEVLKPLNWRVARNCVERSNAFAAEACKNVKGDAYLAFSGSQIASSPNYELDRFSCLHAMQHSPEQMTAR